MLVKKFNKDALLPVRGSTGAAGADVHSIESLTIYPGKRALVGTGIGVKPIASNYIRVAPRSGLANKFGIDVLAGVIDQDYTGEVKVILQNNGDKPFEINVGDRIAQLIQERIVIDEITETDELAFTKRGADGFGSTGV